MVEDFVYHKFSGSKFIFLMLYVKDILLASSGIGLLHETKKFLSKNFEMKDLGNASFVLGIQILRDRSQGILRLTQKSYIEKVLNRFGIKDCSLGNTPVAKEDKFSLTSALKIILKLRKCKRFLTHQPWGVLCMLKYARVWILRS